MELYFVPIGAELIVSESITLVCCIGLLAECFCTFCAETRCAEIFPNTKNANSNTLINVGLNRINFIQQSFCFFLFNKTKVMECNSDQTDCIENKVQC